MKHSELIDAGGAVKYDGQDVPEHASVDTLGDAFSHAGSPKVKETLTKLLRALDGYDDVMYIHDMRGAMREARKEKGLC